MDNNTSIFFAVLRAGLWEREPRLDAAPSAADWQQVLQTARAQAVLGLVYRGMTRLPQEQLPPGEERLRLLADVDRLERGGQALVAAQAALLARFTAAGLHPTVQKGTEAATYYAQPALREAGDIDLYFPAGEFGRAAELVAGYGPRTAPDSSLVYQYEGITVEHHTRYFDLHVRAERLPEVPSVVAELVMLSAHILKHAIGEGVGCKQLCDMARALDRTEGSFDKTALLGTLRACGMLRWHRLLCSLLVSDLGLEPARCLPDFRPCDPSPLRRIVLRGGAFGFADPARVQAARRGPAARKLHAAGAFLRRMPFSLRIAPRETLATLAELVRGNFA